MVFGVITNGDGLPSTIQAAAGTVSVNTTRDLRGMVRLFYIEAATSTTTFDFKLVDKDSDPVKHDRDLGGSAESGTYREPAAFPVQGKYTITIENSSKATETFTVKLMVEEKSG